MKTFTNWKVWVRSAFTLALALGGRGEASEAVPGDEALTHETLFEETEYWPQRLAVTETVEKNAGGTVAKGQRGILIRMESPDQVLVDFGRDGHARLKPGETDLLSRAEAIRAGETEKRFPNWTMMLGRGLLEKGKEGGVQPPGLESLKAYDYFLFLYLEGVGQTEENEAAADALAARVGDLGEKKVCPLVMPLDAKGGKNAEVAEALEAIGIEAPFMRAHLAGPYANSLRHGAESFPFLVLSDVEGKTIAIMKEGESPADFLQRSLAQLE